MEAKPLSKSLVYLAIAALLGLFLVLIPLVAFTEIETDIYRSLTPEFASAETLKGEPIESYGESAKRYLVDDFAVLLTSLAIASFVYILFKHKIFAS
jgi:hypothetical protein